MAANSSVESLAHQRGALAQREANGRRSALIGAVRAPKASSAKRWCAHSFSRGAIALEALLANRGTYEQTHVQSIWIAVPHPRKLN
jgi:hypothetical protein